MAMLGKKHEFKPDRMESGPLHKLYITRKQRLKLLKWLMHALVLLVVCLIQDVLMSRLSFWGTTTDLVSCAILIACIMQDPETGCIYGLITSSLYYCSGSAPDSYVIALLTGIGIVVSIFRQCYLRKGFGSTLICAAGAIMLYELAMFAIGAFVGQVPLSRLRVFCIKGALSACAIPVLYPIFLSIGRIGGESWKE
jgi:hypothetical protein